VSASFGDCKCCFEQQNVLSRCADETGVFREGLYSASTPPVFDGHNAILPWARGTVAQSSPRAPAVDTA
jgi:hypothetical protein